MPIFMIERRYAERLARDADPAQVAGLREINEQEGVRWLHSFLSADLRKTYCLYEAPNADAILAAARRAGIPADVIIELAGQLENTGEVIAIAESGQPEGLPPT